jgi:hypothetical protein
MNTATTNKYINVDVKKLLNSELNDLKRRLECDIAWTERDLNSIGNRKGLGDQTDLLLDNLQIYHTLYKKVLKKLN